MLAATFLLAWAVRNHLTGHRLKKDYLALIQLRRAVQLFNQGDYVCAATLAGAAEELFGRVAEGRKRPNALADREHFWTQFAGEVGKPPPIKKKVWEAHNRLRNQLKHYGSVDSVWVTADFGFEAADLIDRAIRNYWLAYDKLPADRVINHYVNSHWT